MGLLPSLPQEMTAFRGQCKLCQDGPSFEAEGITFSKIPHRKLGTKAASCLSMSAYAVGAGSLYH